jgi:hypothetical protein
MGIRTELNLRLPNSPGALAGVCRVLAAEHVNVVALSLEASGQLRLVVDNPVRAAGALRGGHHQVSERDVIVIAASHAPGGLVQVLTLLRDAGVNVNYAYGGGGEGSTHAAVVIGVDDAQRGSAAGGI